jgi:hypothetical protein
MEVVREFVRRTPIGCAVVMAGREHFFDSRTELVSSLEARSGVDLFTLNEFEEGQAKEYLRAMGFQGELPAWVPTRPLLLGYLCASGILVGSLVEDEAVAPANGWNLILDRVCERESKMDPSTDGPTVRRVLERIATKCRKQGSKIGPLSQEDLLTAYEEVCGWKPDDQGVAFLQRLPGLTQTSNEDNQRQFVDPDYADALRSGDVVRFVMDPHSGELNDITEWLLALDQLGVDMVAHACAESGATAKQVSNAIRVAAAVRNGSYLAVDVLRALIEMGLPYDGQGVLLSEFACRSLDLTESVGDLKRVKIHDALINHLALPDVPDFEKLPTFTSCQIAFLDCRLDPKAMEKAHISADCDVVEMGSAAVSTSALLDLNLEVSIRVGLTVLKKIYLQAGSGRRESALLRGLDHREVKYVSEVLPVLKSEELIYSTKAGTERIWHPVRSRAGEVKKLMAAPDRGNPLLRRLSKVVEG